MKQFTVTAEVLHYSGYTVKLLHKLIKAKTCAQQNTAFTTQNRSSHTAVSAAAKHMETKVTHTLARSSPVRKKEKDTKLLFLTHYSLLTYVLK